MKYYKFVPDLDINQLQLAYLLGYIGIQLPETTYNNLVKVPGNLQKFFKEIPASEVAEALKLNESKVEQSEGEKPTESNPGQPKAEPLTYA